MSKGSIIAMAAEDDDAYDYYLMKATSNSLVTSRSEEMDDCRSYLIHKKIININKGHKFKTLQYIIAVTYYSTI